MSEPLCPKCKYGRMVALFMSGPVCSHDCERNPVPRAKLKAGDWNSLLKKALDAELAGSFVPVTSKSFRIGQIVQRTSKSNLGGRIPGEVVALDHVNNLVYVEFVRGSATALGPDQIEPVP